MQSSAPPVSEGTRLVLHIGLPKTATSFLQRQVFPRLTGIRFLGKHCGRKGSRSLSAHEVFRASVDTWGGLLPPLLNSGASGGAQSLPLHLISDEGISKASRDADRFRAHLREIAEIVRAKDGSAVGAIMVYRRQDHWLASHYAQVSDRMRRPGQDDFERFVRATLSDTEKYRSFGVLLDYERLFDMLVGTLGREQVLALPYEALVSRPEAFLSRILRFLVCDADAQSLAMERLPRENKRASGSSSWSLQRHRVRRMPLRPYWLAKMAGLPESIRISIPRRIPPGDIQLKEHLSTLIMSRYQAANVRLARVTGEDLSRYGYYSDATQISAALAS